MSLTQFEIGLVDIQNDHPDSLNGQILHDLLADAAASSGNQNELAIALPWMRALPVVHRPSRQCAVSLPQNTVDQRSCECLLDERI